jgi:hypothetical protein
MTKKYNGQITTNSHRRLQLVEKLNYHPILCSPHGATGFDIGDGDQHSVSNFEQITHQKRKS